MYIFLIRKMRKNSTRIVDSCKRNHYRAVNKNFTLSFKSMRLIFETEYNFGVSGKQIVVPIYPSGFFSKCLFFFKSKNSVGVTLNCFKKDLPKLLCELKPDIIATSKIL